MRSVVLTLLFAAITFAADITGTWNLNVETDMGSGTPTFTFKQDGEKLTGTYSGQLGEAKVSGTIKGDNVEFWYEAAPQGDKVTVKYVGKLEGAGKMSGTTDLGGLAKGKFTGAKK
jgi:hypothetical protein